VSKILSNDNYVKRIRKVFDFGCAEGKFVLRLKPLPCVADLETSILAVISEDLSCPACHKHYRNKAFPCLKDHAV